MINAETLFINVSNISLISITGNFKLITSINNSINFCKARIPNIDLTNQPRSTNNVRKIIVTHFVVSCSENILEDGTILLKGNINVLTPFDWCDFILSLVSKILQQHQLFIIDATCISLNNDLILLAGNQGAGKSAMAYYLFKAGYNVISTNTCLIDQDMKIHSGSNLFLIRNSYISKYFSDLTSSNLSYPFRYSLLDHDKNNLKIQLNINEIKKINRIYHFKFINSKGGCYQIPRNNDRFKFSNNLISRHICQPTILGSWDVILPFINDDTSLELRSNAIFNMAGLNHYQIMCRFNDFEYLFLRTLI